MRKVGQNNARGEKADCAAKKPERSVLRKIKDPTPLDYDVHDLILYNAIARKEGRPVFIMQRSMQEICRQAKNMESFEM